MTTEGPVLKLGLDIGSTTIKCVVLDDENKLIYGHVRDGAAAYYDLQYRVDGTKVVQTEETRYVYSEADFNTMSFTIGQYPGKCRNGSSYTIAQALRYKKSATESATARFVFRIHIQAGDAYAQLASIDYDAPTGISAIKNKTSSHSPQTSKVYDLKGHRHDAFGNHGLYVVKGRKVVL